MTEHSNNSDQFVKKSSMYLGIFTGLALGFIIGVAFGVWKTSSLPHMAQNTGMNAQDPHDHSEDKISEAIVELEQVVKNHPESFEAWVNLGNAFFDSDQFKKSINAYEKALSINPDNANVWTDLGVMYRRNEEPEKSIQAFDKAVSVDPNHEIARFNKGIVLMHDLNKPEEAIKTWEELLKINPFAKAPSGHPVEELIKSLKEKIKS